MRAMLCAMGMLLFSFYADSEPALTIYSSNFAVVRDMIPLALEAGENTISYNNLTAQLEPDSVILRDPAGQRTLRILEQNYRADPVSQGLLLSYFEGQTIDFLIERPEGQTVIPGKIVRSGYVWHDATAMRRYGNDYYMAQSARMNMPGGPSDQTIIETSEGKLQFGLPGRPLFPQLPDDSILKPTLAWKLETDQAGPLDAELSYVTGGMGWEASYNLVSPETGDTVQLVGWMTLDNQSGLSFENAKVKLVAGDVSKLAPNAPGMGGDMSYAYGASEPARPGVTEKKFVTL